MFSVSVQWAELERYLSREFNREIIRVPGDGLVLFEVSSIAFQEISMLITQLMKFVTKSLKKCVIILKSTRNSIQTVNGN